MCTYVYLFVHFSVKIDIMAITELRYDHLPKVRSPRLYVVYQYILWLYSQRIHAISHILSNKDS